MSENSACYFSKSYELCIERFNWDALFFNLVYIVAYSNSMADQNIKLREVMDRLRTYRLKLQPEKYEFLGR